MSYFYISYCSTEAFLGATIVEADDTESAFDEASRRKLNPGGEAAIMQVAQNNVEIIRYLINRLASQEELLAMGGFEHGSMSLADRTQYAARVTVIRETHNPVKQ